MCKPISTDRRNYTLEFSAKGVCNMGHNHFVNGRAEASTFAEAFRETRKFWEDNAGREITVTLIISPDAKDHLKQSGL